jgi:hypothetical protein
LLVQARHLSGDSVAGTGKTCLEIWLLVQARHLSGDSVAGTGKTCLEIRLLVQARHLSGDSVAGTGKTFVWRFGCWYRQDMSGDSVASTGKTSFLCEAQTGFVVHPVSQSWSSAVCFLGLKRPGRESVCWPSSEPTLRIHEALPPFPRVHSSRSA